MAGEDHPRERAVEKSIEEFIAVILRTSLGESPGNPLFGCAIWDRVAEPVKGEAWLARFKEDVRVAVANNEQRLAEVVVDLVPAKGDLDRNELTLIVQAAIVPSGKPFRFSRVVLTDPIRIN